MSMWQRREGIQLAYPFDQRRLIGGSNRIELWNKPWIVQPKFNGERCRIEVGQNDVVMWSSECNEITTLPHISEWILKQGFYNCELDGEIYVHGWRRQEIGSYIRRNSPKEGYEQVQFHMFDLVDEKLDQFSRISAMFGLRNDLLLDNKDTGPIHFAETTPCTEYAEIEALLMHYYEQGYEGIIIREPHAPYVRRRVTNMMKWKPRKTDSYLIVGYKEEHDKDGNPKGALGAVICETDGETFSIGSGRYLTRSAREQLWDIRESLAGKFATIKYPELTARGVPDHPVLMDITEERMDLDDD